MVHGRGSVDSPAECDEFPLTGEPLGPRDKQILSAPKMKNKLCVMRLSHRQKTRRGEEVGSRKYRKRPSEQVGGAEGAKERRSRVCCCDLLLKCCFNVYQLNRAGVQLKRRAHR